MSIHVGRGGSAYGRIFWEMVGLEHGVSPDSGATPHLEEPPPNSMFGSSILGRYLPRALLVDHGDEWAGTSSGGGWFHRAGAAQGTWERHRLINRLRAFAVWRRAVGAWEE